MHVILWRFQVKNGCEAEFERAYGPDGDWARLFQRGEGYLGSELLRDTSQAGTYVTIDRWVSPEAYAAFGDRWRDEYHMLDQRFGALTERETLLGMFSTVPTPIA
jgi:heme-degrading monooxygenase HmoA